MADPLYTYYNPVYTPNYPPVANNPATAAYAGGSSIAGPSMGMEQYVPAAGGLGRVLLPVVPGAIAGGRAELGMVQAHYASKAVKSQATRAMRRSLYAGNRSAQRGTMGRAYTSGAKATATGTGRAVGGFFNAFKNTMIVSAAITLAENAYKLAKGQEDKPTAAANVAGDMTSAAISGTAASVVATAATPMIANMLNASTRIPLVAIGVGVGIGAYWLADRLLRKTTFFQNIQAKAYHAFGGQ